MWGWGVTDEVGGVGIHESNFANYVFTIYELAF